MIDFGRRYAILITLQNIIATGSPVAITMIIGKITLLEFCAARELLPVRCKMLKQA